MGNHGYLASFWLIQIKPARILRAYHDFAGFIVLGSAWKVLYEAQRKHRLATAGLYARMRYPHDAGFVMILLGFLLQWPTLLTLGMFLILVYMYYRLAVREEQVMIAQFGDEYRRYKVRTPSFFPHLGQQLKPSED